MSVGTAFFEREKELNTRLAWGEWAGYFSAAVYADFHDIEYNAVREAAAVIDVSPLYKYEVSGPDALRLLDRVMTRDMTKLAVDRAYYTPWCDEEGKILDDGTVTRLAEDRYRITAADPCYRWFLMNATGLDVEVADISDTTAALALQGRLSREVLQEVTGADWTDVKYFGRRMSEIAGVPVDVTRTGYTGDRGYELWMPTDGALAVWDRLFDVGRRYGIHAAGIRALDVCRVEAGLILIEAEYTSARHAVSEEQLYSPFELGLGRLVAFNKAADFNGRRALLAEQKAGGPPRRLVGVELDWSGIEAMYAKHGLAPGHQSPHAPRRRPRLQGRPPGGPRHLDHLGPHDQEDGRLRIRGQGAREARNPPLGRVERGGRAGEGGRHRGAHPLLRPGAQALVTGSPYLGIPP